MCFHCVSRRCGSSRPEPVSLPDYPKLPERESPAADYQTTRRWRSILCFGLGFEEILLPAENICSLSVYHGIQPFINQPLTDLV
jgi:hypothetical protein